MNHHAHRRPDGTFLAHVHKHRAAHGHRGATWVEARCCPRCFGAMVLTRMGVDDDGPFEVWRCLSRLKRVSVFARRGTFGRCSLSYWQTAGGVKVEPNEIVLRVRDYEKADRARGRVSA